MQDLEAAISLAELTSFASYLALNLCNRGETKFRIGQLDEALVDLEASRSRYVQMGSDTVVYPLTIIGEVRRERGSVGQAQAAFEDALSISEASGDVQGLVPALAGLAITVLSEARPGYRSSRRPRRPTGARSSRRTSMTTGRCQRVRRLPVRGGGTGSGSWSANKTG